jgi:hypothetical protein
MDWFSALNFLLTGSPEATLTLSDHLVNASSRHGWKLASGM